MTEIVKDTDKLSLTIAPGVIETLIAATVLGVEGVAAMASSTPDQIFRSLGHKGKVYNPGVLVLEEDGEIVVQVFVTVLYGYRLPDIAAEIRSAVAGALDSQVNVEVGRVDVTIEAIQFAG